MAFLFDVVQETAITSGGPTQDFPSGGSSVFSASEAVKAGLFFIGPATANGTALDHARFSIGFTDGTRHRYVTIRSRDAQTTTSCVRQAGTDNLLWIYAAGTTSAAAAMALSSVASNKIVGTWGTFPPSAWLVNAALFGGSDCQAYVGEFTTSATQDGTTVVDATSDPNFNFEFDILITASKITAIDGTSGVQAVISIGLVVRLANGTIKQGCVAFADEDNLAAPNTRVGAELEDDRFVRTLIMGTPTEGDSAEITATSSVGFTATKRGALGGQHVVAFLAIKGNGALQGLDLITNSSRTTTGSQSVAGSPSFPLQGIIGLFTHLTALNTLDTTDDGGTFTFGAANDQGREFSSGFMSRDNLATSDTKCVTHNVLAHVPTSAGGSGITADVTTLPTSTGADLNYSTVLGSARQQLMLLIGRNSVRAKASTVGGGTERSVGKSSHIGRARPASMNAERAAGQSSHKGRGSTQPGARSRGVGVKGAKGQAKIQAGATPKARASSAKGGRARSVHGALEQGKPTLQAGGTSIAATGRNVGQTTGRAQGAAGHLGRARMAAQAAARGSGKGNHPARAVTAPAVSERASGKGSHGGRAQSAARASARAQGASAHGGRARAGSASVERAAGKAGHGGRARATPGAVEAGRAQSAHAGRAKTLAGAATKAQASLAAGGNSIAATGRGVGQTVGKAKALAAHGGRAQTKAGAASKAAGKSQHVGRARAVAGELEQAKPTAQHPAKARSAGQAVERAPGSKKANSRASNAPGTTGKARGAAAHGGRSSTAPGSRERAAGKLNTRGRARTSTALTGRSGIPPEAAMGFYERTSKRVRQALKAVAGTLPIQFSNLPFSEPQGVIWARAWVNFDEIDAVQYGAGVASYRVPGELVVDIRAPIQRGKKALLELADTLSSGLEQRLNAGIVYAAAKVGQSRDAGSDEYRLTLRVPFHAEDSGFARSEPSAGDGDDSFDGAERAVRARFKAQLPDVAVSYDNLPASTGAAWVRLRIDESDAWDVDGVRRTAGVMTAEVHVPLHRGERAALQLADRIVGAFRLVEGGGVRFSIPYLQSGKQGVDEWITPVYAPWTMDRA